MTYRASMTNIDHTDPKTPEAPWHFETFVDSSGSVIRVRVPGKKMNGFFNYMFSAEFSPALILALSIGMLVHDYVPNILTRFLISIPFVVLLAAGQYRYGKTP